MSGDESPMHLDETTSASATRAGGKGRQDGQRGSCELMRSLARKLWVSGLEVKRLDHLCRVVSDPGLFEEIEVDNPNYPARGVIRITDKGEVMWAYFASLETEHEINEVVGIVTTMLCAVPQPMLVRGRGGEP